MENIPKNSFFIGISCSKPLCSSRFLWHSLILCFFPPLYYYQKFFRILLLPLLVSVIERWQIVLQFVRVIADSKQNFQPIPAGRGWNSWIRVAPSRNCFGETLNYCIDPLSSLFRWKRKQSQEEILTVDRSFITTPYCIRVGMHRCA